MIKRNRAWALCISLIVLSTACAPIQNFPGTYEHESEDLLGRNSVSQPEDTGVAEGEKEDQVHPAIEEQNSAQAGETPIDSAQIDPSHTGPEVVQQSDQQTSNDQPAQGSLSGTNPEDALQQNDPQRQRDASLTGFSLDGLNVLAPDQENTALTQDDSPPAAGPAQSGAKPISFQQVQSGDQGSLAGLGLSDVEPPLPSYLIAGFNISDYAEFTPSNGPANPFQEYSTPHVVGVLDLVKKFRQFDTTLGYRGGALLNQNSASPLSGHTTQQLVAQERIQGTRTSLAFEDFLSDGPGVTFGSSGSGASDLSGTTGTSDYYGSNDYGGFRAQHLSETALGQVGYLLSPRSSLIFSGAFSTTHYFRATAINDQQTTGLAGYNYELTQQSRLGVSYGYQYFSYPGSAAVSANSVQLSYFHNLSPRMSFTVAGGPQFLSSHNTLDIIIGSTTVPISIPSHEEGYTAGGSVGYTLSEKELITAYYQHLVTSGSGLYEGASTDIAEVSGGRNIAGRLAATFSMGFSRLSSVQKNSSAAIGSGAYQYWFASASVIKPIGRHWGISGSYQFNDQTATSGCAIASACGSVLHSVVFTLSWRSLPIGLGRGSGNDDTPETPPAVQSPSLNPMTPDSDAGEAATHNYR
jgi:hypothetical protein